MDWPLTPVERLADFRPSFCPWRTCPEHRRTKPGYRYHSHGSFRTRSGRTVARFRCASCRRTFSTQTFSTSYYLKRPTLLSRVAAMTVAGSANRQIARSLRCSHSTVAGLKGRTGRHALLLHQRCLTALEGRLAEPVTFDHFESFEFTQDYPVAVATAVASESWFVLSFYPAIHRRAGRVSRHQLRRLARRPPRRMEEGYARSTRRTFDALLPLVPPGEPVHIRADSHSAYRLVQRNHPQASRIRLECFPNPPRGEKGAPRSAEALRRDRQMFPVDLWHMILRHTLAHHRRETIAFSRRVSALMEQIGTTTVWRNLVKGCSERRAQSETPAMKLGLTDRRWRWERVFSRRLFVDREPPLPDPLGDIYRREWTTPLLASNKRHALSRAF